MTKRSVGVGAAVGAVAVIAGLSAVAWAGTPREERRTVTVTQQQGAPADGSRQEQDVRVIVMSPVLEQFDELDKDHDGKLSREELEALPPPPMPGPGRGPGHGPGGMHWQMLGDGPQGQGPQGQGPQGDMVMLPGGPGHGGPANVMIFQSDTEEGGTRVRTRQIIVNAAEKLDANDDGRITEAEFLAPAKSTFADLDKDKDGALSASEMPPQPPAPPAPPPAR